TFDSFSLVRSFMSDDFYGSLDPNEGRMLASDKLDLAVGRIVADTPELANIVVDKIINYDARASYGRWRNNFVLVSDDVDEAFEFTQLQGTLDNLGDQISVEKPFVNVIKIHSDAFQQQSSAGGDRYPQVNEAIENAIEVGSLVVTYLGHGGEELLAAEAIVTQNEIDNLDNGERLPLVVIVTCEFGKFDNPERPTGGEELFWNAEGGAVGLVTTTREITVTLGVQFNNALVEQLYSFGTNEVQSVAENIRASKNGISDPLRRVIFFVGDPAMKLAFPKPDIQLSAVNDVPVTEELPVLKALDLVKINGRVTTEFGQTLTNYTGTLAVTLYDKRIERQTLGNDGVQIGGDLAIMDFTTLGAVLYRGQASVTNGNFEFTFRMPRDTAIPLGNGRLNFYAERLGVLEDQAGVNETIIIGGLNEDAPEDNLGPRIRLFMNDENFVNGGITNDSPIILAKLEDENGINTASGIGHDIVAIIDGDETNPIIMNDFYETEVDNFMKGTAARKIRNLEPGPHTLSFKAWDVYNNSSTAELQFVVLGDDEIELENVLNYPNPFVNYTEFWFNHNRPFEPLDVQVQIFTVTGKVVKTINQSVMTEGFLSRDITWDGLDDFGQAIGKGVYIYKITVKSTLTNKRVEKIEKLVIL
ncbi:type IX secretion system sortase PorU, partial [Dokdonia donghaensis]|uniref:type IX secretion system sortase PorU n=1 Tax=Dokdonia donghaensis TaxID=326320 RepID=UPI0035C7E4D5